MTRSQWQWVTLSVLMGVAGTARAADQQPTKSDPLDQEPGAVIGETGQATAPVDSSAPASPATATTSADVAVTAPAAAEAQAAVSDAAAKAAKGNQVMEKLNGTEWTIELTPMYGGKPKQPLSDTLQFVRGKVTAAGLAKDSYVPSNCTVTVGDDGVPVWETMQTSENKGVVFWRGELHGDTMRGILSKHPVEGNTEDYSFAGKQSGTVSALSPAASAPAQPHAAQANQPAPAAPTPSKNENPDAGKKRKKGWF